MNPCKKSSDANLVKLRNIDMPPPKPSRRIEFRCLTESDVMPLVALHQNSRVASLIADGLIDSPEMAARYVAAMGVLYAKRPGLGVWMSVDRETATPIGLFGLMPIDGGTDIEIGARLLESGWGRDYAVEGCAALVTHAFSEVSLDLLWATCLPEHRSAQFVLARLGFDFHGRRFAYGSQLVAFTKRRNSNEIEVALRARRDALNFVQKWQETFSPAEGQFL
jgi:[ribosomal protein S5]-alanine N-acetyltransferase